MAKGRIMAHTTYDASSPQALRLRKAAGKYIARLRKEAGLTQREVAVYLDLDYYTFISQLEHGAGRVPPHLYVRLAECLGLVPEDFVKQMVRYYDPFTYAGLFGQHPYDLSDKELEAAVASTPRRLKDTC